MLSCRLLNTVYNELLMAICIVFSDKTGDVYDFPLKGSPQRKDSTDDSCEEAMSCSDEDAEPRPLLGHLSMLLDMVGFRVKPSYL